MNPRRSAMTILILTTLLEMAGASAAKAGPAPPSGPALAGPAPPSGLQRLVKPLPMPVPIAPAPTNISAFLTPISAVLSWAAVPNANGYMVSRAPVSTGPYTSLTSVPFAQTSFVDNTVAPNTGYSWIVSAVYPDGRQGNSVPVTYATLPVRNPGTLTATPEVGGPVTLRWQSMPGASSYIIGGQALQPLTPGVVTVGGPPPPLTLEVPATVAQFVANAAMNLPAGTYTYSVVAKYLAGDSSTWSDTNHPAQASVALRGPAAHAPWLTRLDPHPGEFDWNSHLDVDGELATLYLNKAIAGPPIAKNTLDEWKQANGFNDRRPILGGPLRAVYFNAGDLNIGRDMHCNQNGQNIACYVSNYSRSPFNADEANVQLSLAGAISGVHSSANGFLATVAMEVSLANPSNVKFYVYGQGDSATGFAILDTESNALNHFTGGYSPFNCLACHGGNYDPTTNTVQGAALLPFDVYSFRYSTQPGYTQADQEEPLRRLNALVRSTRPNLPAGADGIVTFIDGMYAGQVGVQGAKANNSWMPPGWASAPNVYNAIVKPFCRTCHLAMSGDLSFPSYDRFRGMQAILASQLCSGGMPQAEVPFRKFWQNPTISWIGYLQDPSVLGLHCN
jgi:hypothetical protein